VPGSSEGIFPRHFVNRNHRRACYLLRKGAREHLLPELVCLSNDLHVVVLPRLMKKPENKFAPTLFDRQFILDSILDTVPQVYQASSGPVVKTFRLGDAEANRCSLRELGLPLVQYIERCLEHFSSTYGYQGNSLPSVMQYEQIQQICANLWLESQTHSSRWNKVIDYFLRSHERTIENWVIAKSFIIDPSHGRRDSSVFTQKIDFLDRKNQRLLDWLATSPFTFLRVTPELEFIAYEAMAGFPVADFSPGYIPDFLWPMASQISDSDDLAKPILVDSNQRGDLLISDRNSILATRIKGRWTVYDQNTLEHAIHNCLRQGKNILDTPSLKYLSHTLFRVLFDVSFKRHGGLIIVDEGLDQIGKYARGGVLLDQRTEFAKIIPSASFGEKSPDITAIRKLIELTSIDGAILLSSSGLMVGYGAMIMHHPDVVDGSGARTVAAKSAARCGAIAFSVSADGEILSYFTTKQHTGEQVHQMRL